MHLGQVKRPGQRTLRAVARFLRKGGLLIRLLRTKLRQEYTLFDRDCMPTYKQQALLHPKFRMNLNIEIDSRTRSIDMTFLCGVSTCEKEADDRNHRL